jgi:hypothetical protein
MAASFDHTQHIVAYTIIRAMQRKIRYHPGNAGMIRHGRLAILFVILALAACVQPQTQYAPYSSANDRDTHGGMNGGGGGGGM